MEITTPEYIAMLVWSNSSSTSPTQRSKKDYVSGQLADKLRTQH
jgi:hypothetical protein